MSEQLIALAEQSAQNDLAFLIKAKEEAKKRMKDDPSPENLRAFELSREGVAKEAARIKADPVKGNLFKTQTAARRFLDERGFKLSIQGFNKHFHEGKVGTNPDGYFEEGALLAYAAINLEPKSRGESERAMKAQTGQRTADQELKQIMADRHRVKLARELGETIPRADHERELSTRAQFFRADLLALPREVVPQLVVALGGDESRIPAARKLLEEALLTRMDFWSSDREFVVPLDQESLPDA